MKSVFIMFGPFPTHQLDCPAGICMFNFNKRNTRARCEICSKLTIKTPERRKWRRSGVFIVNFEHILQLVLVFLLLNLNMQITAGQRSWLFSRSVRIRHDAKKNFQFPFPSRFGKSWETRNHFPLRKDLCLQKCQGFPIIYPFYYLLLIKKQVSYSGLFTDLTLLSTEKKTIW